LMKTVSLCPMDWVGEKCPRCGSVSGEEFFRLSTEPGAEIIRTDKHEKYYVKTKTKMVKFYRNHL
jgi:hypothetical protein